MSRHLWVVEECVNRRWTPVESPGWCGDASYATTDKSDAERELRIWQHDFPGQKLRLVKYLREVKK